ncbi:MAG TPA: FtsX-like permease family protein [Candidatus Binatia bacterium]|nr:FtsX-like permease family protein [Candidatus Binatia bacterium]
MERSEVLFSLAYRSLKNRKLTSILTLLSLALSVSLWVGIEHIRVGARESFSNTISQTDLIVGARGGSLQLLLYTVFHMGSPTANVSYESYDKIKTQPAVLWTIPISLGDSHRGYRVVGTNEDFYRQYRYRQDRHIEFEQGRAPADVFDVALGSEVAQRLDYRLGQRIVITHGLTRSQGILDHDDKPFTLVGILRPTHTPVDRSLYITLEGIEAMHIDWKQGAPPLKGQGVPAERIKKEEIKIEQITAFFLRTKARVQTLALQRQINTFPEEPLMAVIPGVALSELWNGISYGEQVLKVVALFVVIVGLVGMLMALYTSLNERRREIAILRAVGVGPLKIMFLLVVESGLLTLVGSLLGIGLVYILIVLLQPLVEQQFGLYLPVKTLTATEHLYVAGVVLAGLVVGLIPAWKAYRNALSDGLSIRI